MMKDNVEVVDMKVDVNMHGVIDTDEVSLIEKYVENNTDVKVVFAYQEYLNDRVEGLKLLAALGVFAHLDLFSIPLNSGTWLLNYSTLEVSQL